MQQAIKPKALVFETDQPLVLECGKTLRGFRIKYHTWGKLNSDRSNVVWIFHALTANSNPNEWWPTLFHEDSAINPNKDFIVCANMIGSCYGSTGPVDDQFPLLTNRDIVASMQLLKKHLGLEGIKLGIGGSMGGQQLLEWAVQEPDLFDTIVPVATNAIHSAWGIAFNEAQRMALQLNPDKGLEAARAIAMLSYRNYLTYQQTQTDEDSRIDDFSAASYQRYQGEKLRKRFSPYSYYTLSKAMDSHDVGRHYGGLSKALNRIQSKVIVIGLNSDLLFPVSEQETIAQHTPRGVLHVISSLYGHDGFLIETKKINEILKEEIT